MDRLDLSQQRVLSLDPRFHARVLGAPGSGKTTLVVRAALHWLRQPGWSAPELLILAPQREVATRLRDRIEHDIDGVLGAQPARTPSAYAFSLVHLAAAARGHTPPRLLTGAAHDEAIAAVLDAHAGLHADAPWSPEVLGGSAFRTELREFARVLDAHGVSPAELRARIAAARVAPAPHRPDADLLAIWSHAAGLEAEVRTHLAARRSEERSASALMAEAVRLLDAGAPVVTPRLVLVDDAQELGEGEVALLAALARRGARVWAFGDPDLATGAFQGQRSRIMAGVLPELTRRGCALAPGEHEQVVVLESVYRHGPQVRRLVTDLTARVGAGGAGQQRSAAAAGRNEGLVQFARVGSVSAQLGTVAHRLRARHLGMSGDAVPWSDMAVICRSRAEAAQAARVLAAHQVPTEVSAGGLVLAEEPLVRELIRLVQHALRLAPITSAEVPELLAGRLGGLDSVGLRRLRAELRLRLSREPGDDAGAFRVSDLLLAAVTEPSPNPIVDSREGRALHRLARLTQAARERADAGGTAREVLWEIWDGSGLAEPLRSAALGAAGIRADDANRALDAVLGLFFALQRHEEQASDVPISDLLENLLRTTVPIDSLAARGVREAVSVTTPQGLIGREFSLVCVLGPQDGSWPNLRARGSILSLTALERWLRGEEPTSPTSRDTLHDELRLFVHACARARDELLVVSVDDDDHHPGVFFGLGRPWQVADPLPSARLTLRGAVAHMRRRLTRDPGDSEALASLVALSRAGAPGAHPDEWYGVLPLSTERPLGDPVNVDAPVPVRPSHVDVVERCPLDWVIEYLGGGAPTPAQGLGTLLHRVFESAGDAPDVDSLRAALRDAWDTLSFEAAWEADRQWSVASDMVSGLADYLAASARTGARVVAREAAFTLRVGRAELRGSADRIELRPGEDGRDEVVVVDLKTGARRPTAAELREHAQLQAYQLAVLDGAIDVSEAELLSDAEPGGARLLFVHPRTRTSRGPEAGRSYREIAQPRLDDAAQAAARARFERAAELMGAATFDARIEHHCSDPFAPGGSCRLHIIPPVSAA